MKLSFLKQSKKKLLKIKLLKTKIYTCKNNFNYSHLNSVESKLKKIFHIIYKFHISGKKILFLGTSATLNNKIKHFFNNKQHTFIPQYFWASGIITNPKVSFYHLKQKYMLTKNSFIKPLFSLKKIDLVVILNKTINITILKELALKNLPIITLNLYFNLADLHLATYKIQNNYSFMTKTVRNNIFFIMLNLALKKSKSYKTSCFQQNTKQSNLSFKKQ
jgi:hypothetical protein